MVESLKISELKNVIEGLLEKCNPRGEVAVISSQYGIDVFSELEEELGDNYIFEKLAVPENYLCGNDTIIFVPSNKIKYTNKSETVDNFPLKSQLREK